MIYIHWIWYIVSDDTSKVKPVSERESLGQPPRQLMNMYVSLGRRYTRGGDCRDSGVGTVRDTNSAQTIISYIACRMY